MPFLYPLPLFSTKACDTQTPVCANAKEQNHENSKGEPSAHTQTNQQSDEKEVSHEQKSADIVCTSPASSLADSQAAAEELPSPANVSADKKQTEDVKDKQHNSSPASFASSPSPIPSNHPFSPSHTTPCPIVDQHLIDSDKLKQTECSEQKPVEEKEQAEVEKYWQPMVSWWKFSRAGFGYGVSNTHTRYSVSVTAAYNQSTLWLPPMHQNGNCLSVCLFVHFTHAVSFFIIFPCSHFFSLSFHSPSHRLSWPPITSRQQCSTRPPPCLPLVRPHDPACAAPPSRTHTWRCHSTLKWLQGEKRVMTVQRHKEVISGTMRVCFRWIQSQNAVFEYLVTLVK